MAFDGRLCFHAFLSLDSRRFVVFVFSRAPCRRESDARSIGGSFHIVTVVVVVVVVPFFSFGSPPLARVRISDWLLAAERFLCSLTWLRRVALR